MSKVAEINIAVSHAEADEEELDRLLQELVDDLSQLDGVRAIEAVEGKKEPGAMGVDLREVLVKLAEVGGLTALINAIGGWLAKDKRRSLTITIHGNTLSLNNITAAEQEQWAEWFKTQIGMSFTK